MYITPPIARGSDGEPLPVATDLFATPFLPQSSRDTPSAFLEFPQIPQVGAKPGPTQMEQPSAAQRLVNKIKAVVK